MGQVAVFAFPKRLKLEAIALQQMEYEIVSREQVASERFNRLFTSKRHYGFLRRFDSRTCWSLGQVTTSCQGPVASFFEYAETRVNEDFLPYAVCDANRYELSFVARRFIRFGKANSLAKFYLSPRLLVRRLVSRRNRLMVVATEEPFVVKKDLNPFLVTAADLSLYYVLANLNSALHSYLYTEASTAAGKDDFRQTTLAELEVLPIRRIAFTTPAATRKRLASDGQKMFESAAGEHRMDDILRFAEKHLAAGRTDVIHDLLAFLAERMIAMHQEKQAAARGFLTDLRDFHGVDAHALKPKTRLDAFWILDVSDVFAHLRANAKALAAANVRLQEADEEKLRFRFQKAKDLLVPLDARIVFTDRLIDQIVYRLYGLTPDEIVLVEGVRMAT